MQKRDQSAIIDLGSMLCPYLGKNSKCSDSEAANISKEDILAHWSNFCAPRRTLVGAG